jgi:hypothetical protein
MSCRLAGRWPSPRPGCRLVWTAWPGMSGRLVARHLVGAATALVPAGARRRFPVSSARLSPGASRGVFKDRPSIDMGSSRQLLRGFVGGGWPLRCLRFGPTLPGVWSCSAFTVSHRPGGLLRVLSCGFVAPRCRSWGSPGFGSFDWFLAVPVACRPLRRSSPSKLFPRQQPSPFRGLLPSCRSPSGNPVGSASRPCSTGRVRRARKCCHRLTLVASLGFSSAGRGKRVHLFPRISAARS